MNIKAIFFICYVVFCITFIITYSIKIFYNAQEYIFLYDQKKVIKSIYNQPLEYDNDIEEEDIEEEYI